MNFASLLSKVSQLKTEIEKTELEDLSDYLQDFVTGSFRPTFPAKTIPELLLLYDELNKQEHLKYFNEHKLRKLAEEINVIILTLVRDTLQKMPEIKNFSQTKAFPKAIKKNKKN